MCGGCGAKLGRGALRAALASLPAGDRQDVTALPGDDAAMLTLGGQRQVITTDHLRAFTEDPVTMTRIAAIHALGDIWAMGAEPQAVTVTLILPRMTATLQQRTATEIMGAADAIFRAEGAEIVGGHSSMGTELTIGFTLTGLLDRDPITLAGAQPGDALILTKPIGTGVLMAAEMQGAARGDWIAAAFAQMTRPQGDAARLLAGAHAMTDVTGFGLAGHLLNICEASGLTARLDLAAVPLMAGARELSHRGYRSTLFADNRALAPELPSDPLSDLLFDPQTAGGLLAAVAADQAEALVAALRAAGHPAAQIGSLTAGGPGLSLI
jgi:selenide,water dikinase